MATLALRHDAGWPQDDADKEHLRCTMLSDCRGPCGGACCRRYVLAYADFPYPITLTTWHMVFCSIVSTILIQTGAVKAVEGMTFGAVLAAAPTCSSACCTAVQYVVHRFVLDPKLEQRWLRRSDLYRTAIVPIGVAFALVLWLGNAAYLYLSVSFIQMIKALMPLSVRCSAAALDGFHERSALTARSIAA